MNKSTVKNKELQAFKSNHIIRFDGCQIVKRDKLSTTQLKIAMYTAAKVQPQDTPETRYKMTFQEFAGLCKWSNKTEGGDAYKRVYHEVDKLSRSGVNFIDPQGRTVLFNWINDVVIDHKIGLGQISYKISENLMPFYKTREGGFAVIEILDYLPLRGKYALMLYEYLSSWRAKGTVYLSVEQIRKYLEVPDGKYLDSKNLMTRVISDAVEEINTKCEYIKIEITVKRGPRQSIEGVTFIIETPAEGNDSEDDNELYKLLKECGTPIGQAKIIIETYSKDRIKGNIAYAHDKNKISAIKSFTGYVLKAIQDDYAEIEQFNIFKQAQAAKKAAKEATVKSTNTAGAEVIIEVEKELLNNTEPKDPFIADMEARLGL